MHYLQLNRICLLFWNKSELNERVHRDHFVLTVVVVVDGRCSWSQASAFSCCSQHPSGRSLADPLPSPFPASGINPAPPPLPRPSPCPLLTWTQLPTLPIPLTKPSLHCSPIYPVSRLTVPQDSVSPSTLQFILHIPISDTLPTHVFPDLN